MKVKYIFNSNNISNKKNIFLLLLLLCFVNRSAQATSSVWVQPYEIKFNYETGQSNDALTIRKANGTSMTTPEWGSYNSVNENCAYIKSQTNRKIQVRFDSNCEDMHLMIKLTVVSGTGIGEICKFFVSNYHQLDWLTLSFNGALPSTIGKKQFTWKWEIYGIPINDPNFCAAWETTETTHIYYTLLATPQAPMAEPWSSVLDYACVWANGKNTPELATTEITNELYNCGFNYNSGDGASRYTSLLNNTIFYINWFISDLDYPTGINVNCVDMCRSLVCFCNALVANLSAKRINRANTLLTYSVLIPLNCIDPIGPDTDPTNDPFATTTITNDCRIGGFVFHAFVLDQNSSPWDATLKIDIDQIPDNVTNSGPSSGTPCGFNSTSGFEWILPCNINATNYINYLLDNWIKTNNLYNIDCNSPFGCVGLSTDSFSVTNN